jgi:hypothetical protein
MSEKQVLHDLNLNLNEIKKVSKITDENENDYLDLMRQKSFIQTLVQGI